MQEVVAFPAMAQRERHRDGLCVTLDRQALGLAMTSANDVRFTGSSAGGVLFIACNVKSRGLNTRRPDAYSMATVAPGQYLWLMNPGIRVTCAQEVATLSVPSSTASRFWSAST